MTLPPKFAEFRFCPKGKNEFPPDGEGTLHGKIPGRVVTLPYERTGSVKVDKTTAGFLYYSGGRRQMQGKNQKVHKGFTQPGR